MRKSTKDKPTVGAKYGRWTVIAPAEPAPDGKPRWICRCECGTQKDVPEKSLIYGESNSCGCLRRDKVIKATSYDLMGKTFGDLTVIARTESRNTMTGIWWLCQCSCGNTYACTSSRLVSGKRTHCGCKSDRGRPADITGKKFHMLTALYIVSRNGGKDGVIWRCRFDCGNEVDVSYKSMVYGGQISCGCRKKAHDKDLHTTLIHVAGTSVDAIRSKKLPSDNTTGYKGVYRLGSRYMAKIVFQKKQYFLGTYEDIEDAAKARREAERILFDQAADHYARWKELADADPLWGEENPISITVTKDAANQLRIDLLPEI